MSTTRALNLFTLRTAGRSAACFFFMLNIPVSPIRCLNIDPCHAALRRSSESHGQLCANGPALSRRNIVVCVCRRPVSFVEEVLDVDLGFPMFVDGRKQASVEAPETG